VEGFAMTALPARDTALIVVDVQKAFDQRDATGDSRNNPHAIARIGDLLAAFRAKGAMVVHVRHSSRDPHSRFRPELPGFVVKDEAREQPGELVLVKRANSAFIGTDLEARLRDKGISHLVIVGAMTNYCVETTARMGGNLGFDTKLVRDATWTYDLEGLDGARFPAEQVHAVTLANLKGEFAEIVTASDVQRRLE
jgi:nicotinamidase-related amidase